MYYLPTSESDKTLVLESRFESDSLHKPFNWWNPSISWFQRQTDKQQGHKVVLLLGYEYKKNVEDKFPLINLIKPDSIYNSGMKPLFYSKKKAKYESRSLKIFKKRDGLGRIWVFAIYRKT